MTDRTIHPTEGPDLGTTPLSLARLLQLQGVENPHAKRECPNCGRPGFDGKRCSSCGLEAV